MAIFDKFSKVSLVVLDFGGVLRDSSASIEEGYRRGFRAAGLGYAFKRQNVWRLRGIGKYNNSTNAAAALVAVAKYGAGTSLEKVLSLGFGAEEKLDELVGMLKEADKDAVEKVYDGYRRYVDSQEAGSKIVFFDGTYEAVKTIKDDGYTIAVFSNAHKESVVRDLAKVGSEFFSMVITESDLEHPKPSGEGITMIMDGLKKKPEETLYVGDAPTDIMAAKDAGCLSCAVLCGMGTRESLEAQEPDLVMNDLVEVSGFLHALRGK